MFCKWCGKEKSKEEFLKNLKKCKQCQRDYCKAYWRKRHPEQKRNFTVKPGNRWCGKCKTEKPINEFHKNKNWCKNCCKEYGKIRYKKKHQSETHKKQNGTHGSINGKLKKHLQKKKLNKQYWIKREKPKLSNDFEPLFYGNYPITVGQIIDMEERQSNIIIHLKSESVGNIDDTAENIIKKIMNMADNIKTEQIKWERGPRSQTNHYRQTKKFATYYEKVEYIWSQFSNVIN